HAPRGRRRRRGSPGPAPPRWPWPRQHGGAGPRPRRGGQLGGGRRARGAPAVAYPRRTGGMMAAVVRIFLLDDHEVVRRGLTELFDAEDDLEVVGEAGTAEQALTRIPSARPDVAVLD